MAPARVAAAARAVPWAATAAAGALVLLAGFRPDGIRIGGYACGGPTGTLPQVCRQIDRNVSLATDLGWFSVLLITGGAALAAVGAAGIALPPARVALAAAALGLVVTGLVGTGHVDGRFCPGDDLGACGRSDDDWGPVLRGRLLELRSETRAALVGRPTRPGGPDFDREQTLEFFRVSPDTGFELLRWSLFAGLFVSALEVVRRVVRKPWLALVATATGGAVAAALIADWTHPCAEGASECYRGLLTLLTLVAAAFVWCGVAVALFLVRVGRRRWARR